MNLKPSVIHCLIKTITTSETRNCDIKCKPQPRDIAKTLVKKLHKKPFEHTILETQKLGPNMVLLHVSVPVMQTTHRFRVWSDTCDIVTPEDEKMCLERLNLANQWWKSLSDKEKQSIYRQAQALNQDSTEQVPYNKMAENTQELSKGISI